MTMEPPLAQVVEFQPMSVNDADYLYDLCEATMRRYTEIVWGHWNETGSRRFFRDAVAKGEFDSICKNGKRIGAVSVQIHPSCHQLEQLYIEPSRQNQGYGTVVVGKILAAAALDSKPVRLRVLKPNPAKRLYERLGFVVTQTTPERYFMEHQG